MTTKTLKKPVTFIATQYKNRPVQVNFYTRAGNKINFTGTKKIPVKTQVKFKTHK